MASQSYQSWGRGGGPGERERERDYRGDPGRARQRPDDERRGYVPPPPPPPPQRPSTAQDSRRDRDREGLGIRDIEVSPRDPGTMDIDRPQAAGGSARRHSGYRRDPPDAGASAGGRTPISNPTHSPLLSSRSGSSPEAQNTAIACAEASYAYAKYRDARLELEATERRYKSQEMFFASFPALKERCTSEVEKARSQVSKTQGDWDSRRPTLERALATKDAGESSASAADLRAEMDALKKRQEEFMNNLRARDKERDEGLKNLEKYCRNQFAQLQAKVMDSTQKQNQLLNHADSLSKAIDGLKTDVMNAQELAVAAANPSSSKADNLKQIEELKKRVDKYGEEVKKSVAAMGNDMSTLKGRVDATSDRTQVTTDQIFAKLEDLATKAEVSENYQVLLDHIDDSVKDVSNTIQNSRHPSPGGFERIEKDVTTIRQEFIELQKMVGQNHQASIEGLDKAFVAMVERIREESQRTVDTKFTQNAARNEQRINGIAMALKHCDDRLVEWQSNTFFERLVQMLQQQNPNWMNTGAQLSQLQIEFKKVFSASGTAHQQLKQRLDQLEQSIREQKRQPEPQMSQDIVSSAASGGLEVNGSASRFKPDPSEGFKAALDEVLSKIDTMSKSSRTTLDETASKLREIREDITKLQLVAQGQTTRADADRREVGALGEKVEKVQKVLDSHKASSNKRFDNIREWTINATQRLNRAMEQADRWEINMAQNQSRAAENGTTNGHERWRAISGSEGADEELRPVDVGGSDREGSLNR